MVDVYKWSIFDIGQFRQTGYFVFHLFPFNFMYRHIFMGGHLWIQPSLYDFASFTTEASRGRERHKLYDRDYFLENKHHNLVQGGQICGKSLFSK